LSIVGIGPGDLSLFSQKALDALQQCEIIVGYKTYIELLGDLVENKEIVSSGMTQEIKRASYAIDKAMEGRSVSIISSGDPGIYGMAGIVLELLDEKAYEKIDVEIIPAISSAFACASLLGAPLVHDFVVISLSDLLTEWGVIEKRIRLAAEGDFVIVFYNPKSKKRVAPINNAWNILMKYKPPQTPVGIVRNAYRKGEVVELTNLENMLKSDKIDMFATIIVGNSNTFVRDNYMITPRGYILPSNRDE